MTKIQKRNAEEESNEVSSPKKLKKSKKSLDNLEKQSNPTKTPQENISKKNKFEKKLQKPTGPNKKFNTNKNFGNKDGYNGKPFNKNFQKNPSEQTEKPDWNEFKKKKKEEQKKRKENKNLYDVVIQAKKIGENLRRKTLKGGEEERNKITKELHELLGGQGNYPKLVMTHDMARIVQYLLKFSSVQIRKEIAEELCTIVVQMLQSKYARYCVNRMLKYGDANTRSAVIKACYGNAVKLASHAVSATIFDSAFTTWATPLQKQHLVQEFYGEIYKETKDDSVKHLRDVYSKSPEMKTAILSATKANLQRILNKTLLDSHLVQTVFMQFLQECSAEDRSELISQLSSHVVVLSNSKEGSRAAMMCIWYGTNKDRKVAIKTLKEHALSLSKHEHGHCTIITAMDALDDTKLVYKILLSELISHALELAADEWGRKVLLWLVAPADTAYFHPTFIKELNEGRENSTSKKEVHIRRKELLESVQDALLKQICTEPTKWINNSSIAIVTSSILKAAQGNELKKTFDAISSVITDLNFKIKDGDNEVCGIEHAGLHMMLKKLIKHETPDAEINRPHFGESIVEQLNDKIIEKWVKLNRGCFLFVFILESGSEEVQNKLKEMLKPFTKKIKSQTSTGAKIVMKKIN